MAFKRPWVQFPPAPPENFQYIGPVILQDDRAFSFAVNLSVNQVVLQVLHQRRGQALEGSTPKKGAGPGNRFSDMVYFTLSAQHFYP